VLAPGASYPSITVTFNADPSGPSSATVRHLLFHQPRYFSEPLADPCERRRWNLHRLAVAILAG
jgi:hypothetical protein